jgi:hypothetical protein
MILSDTQQKQLFDWLKGKGVHQECLACGSTERKIGDVITPHPTPGGSGTVINGPSSSIVQIVCKNCSFIMPFAMVPIHLSTHDESSEVQEARGEASPFRTQA